MALNVLIFKRLACNRNNYYVEHIVLAYLLKWLFRMHSCVRTQSCTILLCIRALDHEESDREAGSEREKTRINCETEATFKRCETRARIHNKNHVHTVHRIALKYSKRHLEMQPTTHNRFGVCVHDSLPLSLLSCMLKWNFYERM